MTEPPMADRWRLVRGTDLPPHLRFTLLVLMHCQGKNESTWCKRETLADEIGISVGTFSNQTKSLEDSKIIKRVWKRRKGKPSREYAIRFCELAKHQRPPSRESEPIPSRQNEGGDAPTFTPALTSPSRESEPHPHAGVRHEEPLKNH